MSCGVTSRFVESPDEDFGIDPDLARVGVGASERSVALLRGSAEFDEAWSLIVPFKRHSKGRRHIPQQRHRVTNWRDYDAALRNRGGLIVWFTEEARLGLSRPGFSCVRTSPSIGWGIVQR